MTESTVIIYPTKRQRHPATQGRKQLSTIKAFIPVAALVFILTLISIIRHPSVQESLTPYITTLSTTFPTIFPSSQINPNSPNQLQQFTTTNNINNNNNPFYQLQDPDPVDPDDGEEDPIPIVKDCTKLSAAEDKCIFVKENCPPAGKIDYLKFRYCTLKKGISGTLMAVFVFSLLLVVLLKNLGGIADVGFVPSLELVANELKISPAVSGLTLISLGNGAPDVFASITAVKKGAATNDLGLVLGSLAGSTMCICCLILGLTVISSYKANPNSTRLPKGQFARALMGLFFCVVPNIILTAKASLRWWDAVILLTLYIGYVTFNVVYLQRLEAKKQKAALEKRKNVYIESTSSFQVQQTSKSLKQNLLDMDLGDFETADGPLSSNKNSLDGTTLNDVYGNTNTYPSNGFQSNGFKTNNPNGQKTDEDDQNDNNYQRPTDLQVGEMTTFTVDNGINDSTSDLGTYQIKQSNSIGQFFKNLFNTIMDDGDDEDNMVNNMNKIPDSSVDIQYDSDGNIIEQPSGGIDPIEQQQQQDDEEEDQTYYLDGLIPDPEWSKPNLTWKQKWITQLPGKIIFIMCYPVAIARWLSVPSCHHRPDYLRGAKRIFFHISFTFVPIIFGISFIGLNDWQKIKTIWILLICLGIGLGIGMNIIWFCLVQPAVNQYNIKRREVQEIVANKKDEEHLADSQLKQISELMLQYNIDQDDEMAKPMIMRTYMLITALLASISSIAWLGLVAGELVEILSTLGMMFDISALFLGITVLAIGNSVVDLAANLGLAKAGRMITAYSAMFSAPVSSASLGFGLAVLFVTLGSTPVLKYSLSISIITCWVAVIGAFILLFITIPWFFNYRPNKKFGFIMIIYYSIFLIATIVLEIIGRRQQK